MDDLLNSKDPNQEVKPFRVLLKALILLIGFNLILISFPAIPAYLFGMLMPKLDKFPDLVVHYDPSASHGFGLQNVYDINSLFYSHVISRNGKPKNQYRVIFIGDSTVFNGGFYKIVDQQICGNIYLYAYNLGYPGPSANTSLLILQEAMKYSPDLIVWSVQASLFGSHGNENLPLANPDKLKELINDYGLPEVNANSLSERQIIFNGIEDVRLDIRLLTYYLILNPSTRNSNKIQSIAVTDLASKTGPVQHLWSSFSWSPADTATMALQFKAFEKIAYNVPILMVNEPRPSFINNLAQYAKYRSDALSLGRTQKLEYVDIADLVPDRDFRDQVHRNAEGDMLFGSAIMPYILEAACGQK